MLETDYQTELTHLLATLPCDVLIPTSWGSFFTERGPATPTYGDRRRRVRHRVRIKAVLEVEQTLPMIERDPLSFVVYSHDVSRDGLAFVHSQQMFPSETCQLWLPHGKVPLIVTRCQRFNSRCYVVGTHLRAVATV